MENKLEKIEKILSRGIIKEIIPSESEFKERLLSDKPMKFYIGADPTGDSLHLSHAKNFMLLEEFRLMGHKVFVLFGDLTACIGDPSDRTSARTILTREKARENIKSWVNQIKGIINFDDPINPAKVVLNSTWFDKMSVSELIELLSTTTVQRMLERDMFQKRMSENRPVHLSEFIYPIFQGYDSVALDVDVELCGTDQVFNALMGRTLIKKLKNKEKFVVAVNLMEDPITGELMSKSNGTGVFLNSTAQDMFGKIMSLTDQMIEPVLINDTRVPLDEIKALNIKNNPRDAKVFTAWEVVRIFHGKEAADSAREAFLMTFSNKSFPETAPVILIDEGTSLLQAIKKAKPELSNSEIRRLLKQNAVSINEEKITNENELINAETDLRLRVGKLGFFLLKKS